MLICGIILWCVILVSRSRDPTNDRVFFRIYLLSTIIELIVLILKFGHSFRWKIPMTLYISALPPFEQSYFLFSLLFPTSLKPEGYLYLALKRKTRRRGTPATLS